MYEIERIVDKRLRNVRGKKITEYLLRWKGYGAEGYRLEDLDKTKELIDEYERQYGRQDLKKTLTDSAPALSCVLSQALCFAFLTC
jgi:hypothetical protein